MVKIKTVIRLPNDLVLVFDEAGEQILDCQGEYGAVREAILRDAPVKGIFKHVCPGTNRLCLVPREGW